MNNPVIKTEAEWVQELQETLRTNIEATCTQVSQSAWQYFLKKNWIAPELQPDAQVFFSKKMVQALSTELMNSICTSLHLDQKEST